MWQVEGLKFFHLLRPSHYTVDLWPFLLWAGRQRAQLESFILSPTVRELSVVLIVLCSSRNNSPDMAALKFRQASETAAQLRSPVKPARPPAPKPWRPADVLLTSQYMVAPRPHGKFLHKNFRDCIVYSVNPFKIIQYLKKKKSNGGVVAESKL